MGDVHKLPTAQHGTQGDPVGAEPEALAAVLSKATASAEAARADFGKEAKQTGQWRRDQGVAMTAMSARLTDVERAVRSFRIALGIACGVMLVVAVMQAVVLYAVTR